MKQDRDEWTWHDCFASGCEDCLWPALSPNPDKET